MPKNKDQKKLEKIIEATRAIVYEKGYHNLKISEVTTRAKVATGSFYTYFENKDDLLNHLYQVLKKERRKEILSKVNVNADIGDLIVPLFHSYLYHLLEQPQRTLFMDEFEQSELMIYEAKYMMNREQNDLSYLIELAIEKGLVKEMPVPIYISFLHGATLRIVKELIAKKTKVNEAFFFDLVDLFWEGVGANAISKEVPLLQD